ncbi:MAG: MerR family transcriptional regulator [Acidimicrobiales bacterium]
MSGDGLLPIGEVAAETGVAVSTVRYYDELGLISAAGRVGGKRRFDREAIGRVSFVRRSQEVGFSLEEIGAILDDRSGGWRHLVDRKLADLIAMRARLDTMIDVLGEVSACGCQAAAGCPALDTSRRASTPGI